MGCRLQVGLFWFELRENSFWYLQIHHMPRRLNLSKQKNRRNKSTKLALEWVVELDAIDYE
jgi:hypothetical protein